MRIPLPQLALVVSTVDLAAAFVAPRPTQPHGPPLSAAYDAECDVLVLGGGPAGRAIASLLSSPQVGMKVSLADPRFDKEWVPNYGVWTDEWESIVRAYSEFGINLAGCIDRQWPVTDCYFGGSFNIPMDERMRIDRPYNRVDRNALRNVLTPSDTYQVLHARHTSKAIQVNLYSPPGSLVHDESGTTLQLRQTSDDRLLTVRSKLVIDTTGHETQLVLRDARDPHCPPGFQVAYGCLVEIDESNVPDKSKIGPYDKEAMTLFDYRTDHFNDKTALANADIAPTFMYAMPLKDNLVFFEETSLVARPGVSLRECRDRCAARLDHHGIRVTQVLEEEFCYIPMGGALPMRDQRILALGGAAVMVHPSTGYHLCRCLMGATALAAAVAREMGASPRPNLDRVAAAAHHALWTPENIRQRNFAVFGGEFLMRQNVVGLRGFFDGFFKLPLPLWAGFLAGWPGLPHNENHESWWARLWFGLNFIVRIPPPVALDMAASIVAYCISEGVPLPQSVTPLLGRPNSYEYRRNDDTVGDVAVKAEARQMITESQVTADIPIAFAANGEPTDSPSLSIPLSIPELTEQQTSATV